MAAAVIPAGAAAQQATSTGAPDATTLDSVQVTGYRYAIEKSLEKRDANAVVEVITAEDVGKFPTRTWPTHCSACPAWSSPAAVVKARVSACAALRRT